MKVFRKTPSGKEKIASATASKNGDRYMWATGNTGLTGKFFAKAGAIPGWQSNKSKDDHGPPLSDADRLPRRGAAPKRRPS